MHSKGYLAESYPATLENLAINIYRKVSRVKHSGCKQNMLPRFL